MAMAVPVMFTMDAVGRGLVTIAGTDKIATTVTAGIPSRPANAGEYLIMQVSGLGEVVDGVNAGTAAPLTRTVPTANKVKLVLDLLHLRKLR